MPSVSSPPLLTKLPFQPQSVSPRLLFLASTRSQGGIERHSVELAAALRRRGVPLQFACPPGSYVEKWCEERGVPTLPFQVRNSGDLNAALVLAKLIRAERIDIVHSHSRRDYVIAVLGVALARLFFRRHPHLILHAHMVRPLGEPPRLSGKFFEQSVDAVVAVSGAVSDRLRHDHGFHPAFVHLIHNGVNVDEFAEPGSPQALAHRSRTRQEWAIPDIALVLGMIGRLDTKGQAWLLEIAPALVQKHPDLHFVFIGSEGKLGEQAQLAAQAASLGLGERLHFTGPREDIPALLPALDILVHLPRDESFGLALAEAMAAGLPTVATAIGGCREVVRDGLTGRLVSLGDSSALNEALLWLLDDAAGPARRQAWGEAGREVVADNFSRTRQLDLLQALYQELCPVPLGR
jgi:glycosyltransferase involved in cell wall biosynthesis